MILHLSNSLELLIDRLKENIESWQDALIVVSDMQSKTALLTHLHSFGLKVRDRIEEAKEIHIFGMAALPSECEAKVFVYALSPCMHFWSDICSDKEAKKLTKNLSEKHKEAVQEYLYDRSKLLANNSGPIREAISSLIEKADDIREEYVLKEWMKDSPYVRQDVVQSIVKSDPSLFDLLQRDMLFLGQEMPFELDDETVSIHSAPTRNREVEVLYQYLQKASFDRAVIYAPDIEPYRPYIKSLFTHSTEIVGSYQYEILDTFIDILRGNTSRLFANRSFQKKWAIAPEDLALASYVKKDILASWISEDGLGMQDIEVVGKFLAALQGLKKKEDIMPCSSWQRHFMNILDAYFAEDMDEFYLIKRAIMKAYNTEGEMSLDEAIECFRSQIDLPCRHAIAPFVFTSLGSCRSVPRDVVCFLGMSEGAFPRSSSHLVIEAIVAAKKGCFFSYEGFSFQDRKMIEPHSIVLDVVGAIHKDKGFIQKHTLSSETSKIYLQRVNEQAYDAKRAVKETTIITLQELSQLAKYPLKRYYQESFGLYLQNMQADDDALELKNQYLLRTRLFSHPKEMAKEFLKNELYYLPSGLKQAASILFEEENEEFHEQAKALGIDPLCPIEVEFTPAVKQIEQVSERSWKIPAIDFAIDGEKILVTGKIGGLYKEGIILFEKKSKASLCKIWPELLLLSSIQKTISAKAALLYLKDKKAEEQDVKEPLEKLKDFVAYALEARKRPSLLYPDYLSLLAKDAHMPELDNVRDPYLDLHLSRKGPDALQEDWSWSREKLLHLYGEVYEF